MSNSSATKFAWSCLNTKEDLFKLFAGLADHSVIEIIIENRNDNLLEAYRDLIKITRTTDTEQNTNLSSSVKNATSDSDHPNYINFERLSKHETPTNRILYLVSNGYKVLALMRGCPGSGKSYQATNILNECYKNANADDFIISADKFFMEKRAGQIRYNYNRSKLSNAHQWAYQKALEAIECEVTPVFIDNTNIQVWEMEKYVKLGVNNGYWIEILEPTSEWAWNGMELFKRNEHNVPYENIMSMLQRYDHNITVDNLLNRFNLKYNKKTQPPTLSNKFKKYKLHENRIDNNKFGNPQYPIDFPVDDQFTDLYVSQKHDGGEEKNHEYTGFNNSDEDSWSPTIQKEEKNKHSVVNELESPLLDIIDEDEECKSILSFTDEASNYVNKSVNTNENDFLFMGVLNEIPEEEYRSYVVFGKNKDINEGNKTLFNTPSGKLDKGTTTNDLIGIKHKLNLNELHKEFPENVCLLITELFDKCEGNIDWIVDMLEESGHDISKQQMHSLIQFEENNFIETTQVQENIEKLSLNNEQTKHDNNSHLFSPNKIIEESNCKKKNPRRKVIDSKGKKNKALDKNLGSDLRKNIESKFIFGDSSYSEQVLKVKKFKESQNMLDDGNIIMQSNSEMSEEDFFPENNEGKFVQLVVDTSVLAQLCDYFGDFSSDISKTTLPMSVKLPEKLAEDLYYCLIANVPPDIFNQDAILQDETLARKLQEESSKEKYSNSITNSYSKDQTFAAVLSKKLLLEKFKSVDSKLVLKVLRDNDYKFQEANDFLSQATNARCLTNKNNAKNEENEESFVGEVEYTESTRNQNYRQEALKHANMKQQFMNKANQSLTSKKSPGVTAYYLERAEEAKQNEIDANTKALIDLIQDNDHATKLDLHYLPVHQAKLALDIYLDNHISNLKKQSGGYNTAKQLSIITGRGKHSPNGVARIRPVVVQRIKDRQLMYFEPVIPGLIMVIIKKNSLLSSEL